MKTESSIAKTTKPNTLAGRLRTACAAWLLPLLLLLALPAAVQAQDFTYTTSGGKVTITGYTGPGGAVTIPSTIDGLPVTSIGGSAFYDCTSLTSVTIPTSVTSIGVQAFQWCSSLTSVTIPNSVTSIGANAFYGCTSLTSVTIPKSVTSIGGEAFSACASLTAITVDALNSAYCSVGGVLFNKSQTVLWQYPGGKAGSCTIPASVIGIGESALFSTNLTAITVSALNSVYSSADGVLFNKSQTTLVAYPGGKAGSYTIPNSVTSVGDYAFYGCTSLTGVTIAASVTSIGGEAFLACTSLTSVTIPDSVTNIEGDAFKGCTSLSSVMIGNSVTSIGGQAFLACTSLTGVYFKGNAPTVGSYAFAYDDNATVYYLPGTTGWGTTFGGRPTALWNPQVQTSDASFGVRTNQFGFNIAWASGQLIVVEACTNLANPIWSPVETNALTGGSFYFSDPKWTNYPGRFYRLRSP